MKTYANCINVGSKYSKFNCVVNISYLDKFSLREYKKKNELISTKSLYVKGIPRSAFKIWLS